MRLINLFVSMITLPVVALLSVIQLILDAAVYLSSIIAAPFIAIGGLLLIYEVADVPCYGAFPQYGQDQAGVG